MYAVLIVPYTKSIRVIPLQWVLNFDKNIVKKESGQKTKFLQNPIQKGFAE
jgi:hypothetical protein